MLSSGCNYCIDQLTTNKSNEDDLLPLPHLLLDVNKMGFKSFLSGGSFDFNHPLFCPQILISNQAIEKLNLANRELKRPNCPCQYKSFKVLLLKSTHDEILNRCHNGKCAFKQNGDIIEELAKEYQSKLEKNGISVPKKERNCCMLSSNQPNKIIQEDLFTKMNYEFICIDDKAENWQKLLNIFCLDYF